MTKGRGRPGRSCPSGRVETTMRESEFNLRHLFTIVAIVAAVLVVPIRLHAQSSAVTHIQSYYQQLMPTIQQAGRLSVRERDKRFTPAISSAFDLPTMTRLAVGPAWQSFSPAQQAAVRDAFAKFRTIPEKALL